MKKAFKILLIVFISFLYATTLDALEGYTTESYVRVRSGAGTNSDVLGQINNKNTTLSLVSDELYNVGDADCSAGWYKINYNNREAYICGLYVSIGSNNVNETVVINTESYSARIEDTSVYAWAGPGYSYSAIEWLLPGTNIEVVASAGNNGCSKGWVKIRYDGTKEGYVCSKYIVIKDEVTDTDAEYEEYLRGKGFPDTYIPYLVYLHKKYPSWEFNAIQTNLYWDNVISSESTKNYIETSREAYIASSEPKEGYTWFLSKSSVNAFYIDPRNFLTEKSIFMFENLAYNYDEEKGEVVNRESEQTIKYYNAISNLFNNSYLNTDEYKYYYIGAGFTYNVSPIHLAARSVQEGASRENYAAVSGNINDLYNGYSVYGYYNMYNIGAYGTNPVMRGLWYACGPNCSAGSSYNRPWDSREKAIYGGAEFLSEAYISVGQNTLYFEKFNTSPTTIYGNYTNQYMTNVMAPLSEGQNTYYSYSELNLLNEAFTFDIPIYLDMPESVSLPTSASTINTLEKIIINSKELSNFSSDILEYKMYISKDTNEVNIEVVKSDSKSVVSGDGVNSLNEEENNLEITVRSESGEVRVYKVTIIKVVNTQDISDIISSLAVKTNNDIMYSIRPNTTGNTLIQSILKVSPEATVIINDTNFNGVDINNNLKTGDIINITAPSGDSKSYKVSIIGDVSGDGDINTLDLLKVLKHIKGDSVLSGEMLQSADTNNDGVVDSLDLLRVLKVIKKDLSF